MSSNIYKNKKKVAKNIKTIRCYLELNKTDFAKQTNIGGRAMEFETGRFLPSEEELKKIADLANIDVRLIINSVIQTELKFY